MAVSSTIEYCTDRDLQDIFPHLSEYNLKRRLYNFTLLGVTAQDVDTITSCYIADNSGLVTNLFIDGQDMSIREQAIPSTQSGNSSADTAEVISYGETKITTENGHNLLLDPGWIIGIGGGVSEKMLITSSNVSNTVEVRRGFDGSTQETSQYASDGDIYFWTKLSQKGEWTYSSNDDCLLLTWDSDPNDSIIEAGDDWATIKTRFRRKASRLIESHLDNRLSREVLKDREGNYPEIIVHATALQTVILLLKAHDPNSEIIAPFKDELDELIDGLKAGSIVLPTSISGDSSKGVIREVSVNSSSDLRPIELRGHYNGSGYELLKLYIDSGENGIIGTTKMTVKGKDSTLLKTDTLIDSEVITGDFQHLGVGSLYIRWGGDDVATAITTAADEYEIELWGSSLDTTVSSVGSMRMTRR